MYTRPIHWGVHNCAFNILGWVAKVNYVSRLENNNWWLCLMYPKSSRNSPLRNSSWCCRFSLLFILVDALLKVCWEMVRGNCLHFDVFLVCNLVTRFIYTPLLFSQSHAVPDQYSWNGTLRHHIYGAGIRQLYGLIGQVAVPSQIDPCLFWVLEAKLFLKGLQQHFLNHFVTNLFYCRYLIRFPANHLVSWSEMALNFLQEFVYHSDYCFKLSKKMSY